MSLSNQSSKVQYVPNGIVTTFNITFPFLQNSHIVAILISGADPTVQTTLVLGVDYTLTGAGDPSGGVLTTIGAISPIPANSDLTIKRVVPLQQLASYIANDAFPSATHEQALDILTMITQQLAEALTRCLMYNEGETVGLNAVLPTAVNRQNKTLGFDAFGVLHLT
jgi:hypothetical protein